MNCFRTRSWSRGFTLIELLIVVAIIAILAAIAVPNFLEAQTRSKVARCKADMRSVATAVEAYVVDWNRAMPGYNEASTWNPQWFGFPQAVIWDVIYGRLTTPVAYMTSIPDDPFSSKGIIGQQGQLNKGTCYIYQSCYLSNGRGKPMAAKVQAAAARGIYWFMYSRGPMRRQSPEPGLTSDPFGAAARIPSSPPSMSWPEMIYDPTNGAMSFGWLIRSNKEQM